MKNKIIIVQNNLPMSVQPNSLGEFTLKEGHLNGFVDAMKTLFPSPSPRSEDGTNSIAGSEIKDISDYLWVGMPDETLTADCEERSKELLTQFHSVPVIVTPDQYNSHMKEFCRSVIYPIFHYRFHTSNPAGSYNEKFYSLHLEVMTQFAKVIERVYEEGDLIWIHDFHLMMLPGILRKTLTRSSPGGTSQPPRIGFLLHSPFPSVSIFPMLPVRREILESLLACTVVGFQTYEHMGNFLSSCTRILGLDYSPKGVESYDGRMVYVGVYPISIDPKPFEEAMGSEMVKQHIEELRKFYKEKRVIFGRDRGDQVESIPSKLRSFEYFLTKYPEWVGNVVYFQICTPDQSDDRNELWKDIHELVGRINGKFGCADYMPIKYLAHPMSWDELVAIYTVAEVAVVTPLNQSVTVTPYEYTVCQNHSEYCGVIVLSEFIAAAQSLGGAIQVNPWSKRDVSRALNEALTLNEEERRAKQAVNYDYVTSYSTLSWAKTYISELSTRTETSFSWRRSVGNSPLFQQLSESSCFDQTCLDLNLVIESYNDANRRVFLLNYDGGLCSIARFPHLGAPSSRLISILANLCDDEKNEIYLFTGRDKESMERWMGYLPVGLSCEHGAFYRDYKHRTVENFNQDFEWEDLVSNIDMSWMDVVLPFLEHYTERTPGSFIEKKQASIVWHYRICDPEYSAFQAQELLLQIQSVSAKFPIEVFLGKKAIEVKPKGIGEGNIIKKIIGNRWKLSQTIQDEKNLDFVLCIGDGKADEDMFAALDEIIYMKETGEFTAWTISCFTSTIRRKTKTNARYFIPSQPAVIDLLDKISSSVKLLPSPIVVPPSTKIMNITPPQNNNFMQTKSEIHSIVSEITPVPVKKNLSKNPKSEKKKKRGHHTHLTDLMSKMLGTGKL